MSKKIIKLQVYKVDLFPEKIPLSVLGEIWNDDSNKYSEKDLLEIREFGYLLLEAIIGIAKRKRDNIVLPLNTQDDETEKGNIIYPCEYGRAS